MARLLLPLLGLLLCAANARPAGPPDATKSPLIGPVDFQRDIRPILSNRCFKCHGPGAQQGGARLDLPEAILKRKIVVPGNPDASRLIYRITTEDERMPPAESDDPLSAAQIAQLRAWIKQGAPWAPHWAYVAPRACPLPAITDPTWPVNGVDRFILARLERAGLRPSPRADRATLIRRVYLDLVGLLPEPHEVDAFCNDPRPDAYERVVDRLLASPHYGERQARHWLDLARYADSNGYTVDGPRSIWPYRDWVIAAFNADMPFDQFTIQQLAGDLLPRPTRDQLVGTGFHRNTPFNEEGGTDPEQFRVERTLDRTNTTGTVWLGLTVACAQCHDHKFDSISQKEYYQLYAFFNSTEEPALPLPAAAQESRLREMQGELTRARAARAAPLKKQTPDEMAASLSKEGSGGWKLLAPAEMKADRGTRLSRLGDQSVLAAGPTPDTEVYRIKTKAAVESITAVRLEALTHPSLPRKGPGRAGNGNFVLSLFTIEVDGRPVPIRSASADHSQPDYAVSDALLGQPRKGWAINTNKPAEPFNVNRQAVFILDKPLLVKRGATLSFTLKFSEWPKRYPLGRFRLAAISASDRFLAQPLWAQRLLLLSPELRTEEENDSLLELLAQAIEQKVDRAEQVRQLQGQLKALEKSIPSTLVLRQASKPRATHIYVRGDFLNKGSVVQPGTLASLPPLGLKGEGATRLDLARWLVRPDHPLTARVVVNRTWGHYFGKGLVETENDFGMQGTMPTHPELLDWLALAFVGEPGASAPGVPWSMKRLHRLIVTSATYRQSSVTRTDLRDKDPNNHLLGRQVRLRVEAEILRDAALTASGLLSRQLGGPGVYPPQSEEVFRFTQGRKAWPESQGPDRFRRGLYTFIWRQSQYPLLATFDGADAQTACTRRNRSNTPLQALHLANNRAFIEIAEGLAQRLLREGPKDDAGALDHLYRLCLGRLPAAEERDRLLQFLAAQKKANPEVAWAMAARVVLNLDEFVTRE